MQEKNYHTAVVHKIIQETETAQTFVLRLEQPITYLAGQFLTMLSHPHQSLMERRAYSFSSAPGIDEFPAITIKRTPNGLISRHMIDRVEEREVLLYSHVAGHFILPEDKGDFCHFVLFAAGSGIVPIYSLLKSILRFHPKWNITLIYSSHSENETLFYQPLKQWAKEYSERLKIEWLISHRRREQGGRLSHFLLLDLLKKHLSGRLDKALFYLCGPFEYIDMIQIVLLTEGIRPIQIKKEHFYIPRSPQPPEPPDKNARDITIHLGAKIYKIRSEYPDTILDAALENGVPLNYSCKSGQCGSCLARCVSGKVWMRYNEVLTEAEIRKGYVLTCNAFPIEGSVDLVFGDEEK